MTSHNAWPEARVKKLRELWFYGLPASAIAKELGEGLTRNAVLGKIYRLGLHDRNPLNSHPGPHGMDVFERAGRFVEDGK